MARAQSTDLYHAFKFAVSFAGADKVPALSNISAGFSTCVMPEINMENVEYKEGIFLYRRKYVGDATFSDITLTRGVAKKGTHFYDWIMAASRNQDYRVDFQIMHFHRDDVSGMSDFSKAAAKRIIKCYEAIPLRVKTGSDLDGQSSEISIEEIDIAIERFEIVDTNT